MKRTVDAVSPLTTQQVGISLMAFIVIYFLVFGTGVYYLLKLMRTGPALPGTTPDGLPDDMRGRPARHALPAA
jgi:cytochrome d ubiquinol oxidase subunit I